MKRLLFAVSVLFVCGCHLHHPLTQAQVLTILSDAGWGIEAGCVAEWLEPPTCVVARRVLADATTAAQTATSGWQAAAKAVLVNEEATLAPDSKLRPYFDAAIFLL